MSLREYQRKRDFARTPEPRGKAAAGLGALSFVVQKHDASRLHYDFRLEHDGVLKSWAVPKGPSLDPGEKRLAVEVEDHPLNYGAFEGVIPAGQYGGGTVLVWDRGTWVPDGDAAEGLRRGRLEFELHGEKLAGRWLLVRMAARAGEAKPQWLLRKRTDDAARAGSDVAAERPESVVSARTIDDVRARPGRVWKSNRDNAEAAPPVAKPAAKAGTRKRPVRQAVPRDAAPLPSAVAMELPTLVAEVPAGDGWLHEIKLDGYRLWCRVEGRRATLWTRSGKDWSARFPGIVAAVAALPVASALLDGELVVLGEDGRSSFQRLQRALLEGGEEQLRLVAFDLLHLDGADLRGLALTERKDLLRELLDRAPSDGLRFSDHVGGDGAAFFREACRLAVEGVVSKRRSSTYRNGRTRDWLKTKCLAEQEFVIGGYTEPTGSRAGLGALLVGTFENGALRFAGRVGTGFDRAMLNDLAGRLRRIERRTAAFADPPRGAAARGVHWVAPRLVAQIRFAEWTADGKLRHPSFQGLREDKEARAVHAETPAQSPAPPAARAAAKVAPAAKPTPSAKAAPRAKAAANTVAGVVLSHPERVLYPDQELTKLDLARYYEAMAEWVLPHVQGRPLMLLRCPRGSESQCFVQKHFESGVPDGLEAVEIVEDDGPPAVYGSVRTPQGLISLVQLGALELHVWGSRQPDLEHPDRLIFDLDPAPDLAWTATAAAAEAVRERLADLGLESWPKSSGGKGLHVVVPLAPELDWQQVKAFARTFAEGLVAAHPELYVSKASKAARPGRVFIDYLRNGRGATSIAAFSPRARAGAPVSVPLRWADVDQTRPPKFTVATLPARMARLRRDPWEAFWKRPQSLEGALRAV